MSFEEHLKAVSRSNASPLALQMVQQLGGAIVDCDPGNKATNRKLWDLYAKEWGADKKFVADMANSLGLESAEARADALKLIGDEWSQREALEEVFADFIAPHVGKGVRVAEIGSGGGRVSVRTAALKPARLQLFDVSMEMLKRARKALIDRGHTEGVGYCHLKEDYDERSFDKFARQFDFVYCFDVMVHLDLHTVFQYFRIIRSMLADGGLAFVSCANLCSPLGWARFAKQSRFTVGGFYFMCPEMVRQLARQAGLEIVREAGERKGNVYYNRDFLCVMRRADDVPGSATQTSAALVAPPPPDAP